MRPKSIGIIGGAGPLAGTFMLERIFSLASTTYGCNKDADFPKLFLISFPFSEMLSTNVDVAQVQTELSSCLQQLRSNGASILAIACNTLHAFLDEQDEGEDLIHLLRTLAEEIPLFDVPCVFCTSTSARFGLHKKFFACEYPDQKTQKKVDTIIDRILKWDDQTSILMELEQLIQAQNAKTIVLGCTELSLFTNRLSIPNKLLLDPLEMVSKKIIEKSFSK